LYVHVLVSLRAAIFEKNRLSYGVASVASCRRHGVQQAELMGKYKRDQPLFVHAAPEAPKKHQEIHHSLALLASAVVCVVVTGALCSYWL
jgi:hypothetical protein